MQFFKIFLYHNYILSYFCTKSQQKREKSPLFTGLFSWISKFSQKWNLLLYLTFLPYFSSILSHFLTYSHLLINDKILKEPFILLK